MEHSKPTPSPERKKRLLFAPTILAGVALSACAVDSYLTDTTNVQCDSRRTRSELYGDGNAIFIVHGKKPSDQAVITVNRKDDLARVKIENDTSASPRTPDEESVFGEAIPIAEGPETHVIAGGGDWIIDVRATGVVIEGTCDGI